MLTMAVVVGLATRAHAEDCVYDANADFDASTVGPSNPSGEWSYEYGIGPLGARLLMPDFTNPPLDCAAKTGWFDQAIDNGFTPSIAKAYGGDCINGNVSFLQDELIVHAAANASQGNLFAHVVLTVPASGVYDMDVTFIGRQLSIFNSVHVVVNGVAVFDAVIEEDGDTASYAATALALSVGDIVLFSTGPNGTYGPGNIALEATLVPTDGNHGIDSDADTVNDACDSCPGFDDRLDGDLDLVPDDCDVCPVAYDPRQEDADGDGSGDVCDACPLDVLDDTDGDGACDSDDCDDVDPVVYPNAPELCDGIDNACRGYVLAAELDEDGDGEPTCAGDCDDANPAVLAGHTESCNGLDDDCDGALLPDELDFDQDGVTVCEGDCDDSNDRVSPTLVDICDDSIDNDCDGAVDQNCGEEPTDTGCTCNGTGAAGPPLLAILAVLLRSRRQR